MAHNDPKDSVTHINSRFDSLVEDCAARLRTLMNANAAYEAAGQTNRLQYVVRLGFDDSPTPPNDSTFYQRNAAGAPGFFEPGSLLFTIISDSLRKWNTENTVKSYMLYVNGLFFGLDKKFEYKTIGEFFNSPNEQFRVKTEELKKAHADITKAIYAKVATTGALQNVTALFSIGAYQTNAIFKTVIKSDGTPTDSTWVQTHLLLTAYPKAGGLAETDDRKKLITLVHNAMIYEKPAFTTSRDAINDERMVIGGALKRIQKHKQILVSTTPNQLDDIFRDFQKADYMALTLPERVHALKVMAGGAMGNNMYNSREAYAVMMVQHTPDEQQKGLLDKLMVEKATGSQNILLRDLVTNIDNGHFVNESNDLDDFITSIAGFIYKKMPPDKTITLDSILIKQRTIGIKPGFWFGDDVFQHLHSNGIVRLENRERNVTMSVPAYDYVYLCFNGQFIIGDKVYRKNEKILVPALIAQLVFNNHNSSRIKTGLKTVFDLALLLTGVGEVRLALEAGKAWPVAKAIWNMGWATSDFFINGVLAEKLAETESGRKFLMWYNRVQLVAGGLGLGISIYDIRQGIKNSRKELEQDLVDNKLKRELEYGTSEVQVTNTEKDDIIRNLQKEEDEAARKLRIAENAANSAAAKLDNILANPGFSGPNGIFNRLPRNTSNQIARYTSPQTFRDEFLRLHGLNNNGVRNIDDVLDDFDFLISNHHGVPNIEKYIDELMQSKNKFKGGTFGMEILSDLPAPLQGKTLTKFEASIDDLDELDGGCRFDMLFENGSAVRVFVETKNYAQTTVFSSSFYNQFKAYISIPGVTSIDNIKYYFRANAGVTKVERVQKFKNMLLSENKTQEIFSSMPESLRSNILGESNKNNYNAFMQKVNDTNSNFYNFIEIF